MADLDQNRQPHSEEPQGPSREQRLEVAAELRELLDSKGWAHRSQVWHQLRMRAARLLETSVEGYQVYRAQGALEALGELQNTIIEMAEYTGEGEEDEAGSV